MAEIQTIRRNLALKELEAKETPDGKQVAFSIKFVTKNGELVFMPRAVADGLRFDMKSNRYAALCQSMHKTKPSAM